MTSVAIIDENPLFRAGLEKILTPQRIRLVAETHTGTTGISLVRQHKPQIVLINAQLPDMTGEWLCCWIHRHFPETRMIFFLNAVHWPTLSRLIETPAQGFLTKEAYYSSVDAIKWVQAGKTYLQSDLALGLLRYRSQEHALEKLSLREYEVLARVAKGQIYEEIAEAVPMGIKTVYNLKAAACKKLNIQNREQICKLFP